MKFIQARNYSPAKRASCDLIVIHTAECGETAKADENVGAYFAGAHAPKASAHYMADNDSVTQYVLEKDIAWHAGPANGYSIGIEHAGYAKQTAAEWRDEYSDAMLERSAKLAAEICTRYSIPVVKLTAADLKAGNRRGFCGHIDVTNGLTAGKGHWDPGPSFPWDEYLDRVREYMDPDLVKPTTALHPVIAPALVVDVDLSSFVEVVHAGVTWLVCPIYVGPVSIGQAVQLARDLGCELPTPGLVDEIWRAADLKLDASKLTRTHDGTPKTMNSPETHADQAARIGQMVGDRSLGRDFRLLAGAFKDVVTSGGKVGLYGWHRTTGVPIQPFYAGHALAWGDYSQGLRLVRRKA